MIQPGSSTGRAVGFDPAGREFDSSPGCQSWKNAPATVTLDMLESLEVDCLDDWLMSAIQKYRQSVLSEIADCLNIPSIGKSQESEADI